MSAVDALRHCGGDTSRSESLDRTTVGQLRAALAAGAIVRVGRGRYALPGRPPDRAAALAHDAVVSHLSAAGHWDLPVLSRPDVPQLTVARHRRVEAEPRATIRYGPVSAAERRDRVTSPARTVIDCARVLPLAESIAIADGAVKLDWVRPQQLQRLAAAARGPGSARIRRAMSLIDVRAESPIESALRVILVEAGIEGFEPQVPVRIDAADRPYTLHVDLGNAAIRLGLEAEGFEFHGHRHGLVDDCRRYDELVAAGWRVLRFSYEHIVGEQDWIADVVRRASDVPSEWQSGGHSCACN